MNEAQILLLTAASIAFLHTILGPDHYLVFTAMGKARSWSLNKTLRITLFCGLGHILGSVVIGVVGIILGAQLRQWLKLKVCVATWRAGRCWLSVSCISRGA